MDGPLSSALFGEVFQYKIFYDISIHGTSQILKPYKISSQLLKNCTIYKAMTDGIGEGWSN